MKPFRSPLPSVFAAISAVARAARTGVLLPFLRTALSAVLSLQRYLASGYCSRRAAIHFVSPEVCHGCATRPDDPRTTLAPLCASHAKSLSGGRRRPHQTFPHRPRSTLSPASPGLSSPPHDGTQAALEYCQHHPLRPDLFLHANPQTSRRGRGHAAPAHATATARSPQRP